MQTNDPIHATVTIALSGTGSLPHISVSPTSLDLGNVYAACQAGKAALTIYNTGGVTLSVISISISGPPFGATNTNTLITPGGSFSAMVTFTPTAVGPVSGSLMINSDDPTTPQLTVVLHGNGLPTQPPSIAVAPTSLDFGSSVPMLTQSVTVANSSGCQSLTGTLNTNGPFFIGTGSVAVQSLNYTVGPQSSEQFQIAFTPTTAGLASGTLVMSSNDPVHPTITVPLSGTGVNNAMFCAQSSIQILECDREVQVTMQNVGNTTWTTAHGYRLGSQNPPDNWNWDNSRVDLPNDVLPGQSVTFDFWINATVPANHTYNYQWRMVQDGIAWFGDFTPNQRVLVVPCHK